MLPPVGGEVGTEAPPIVHEALRGPSAPLDADTRSVMEQRLGADLSRVRVHTDDQAAASARALNAAAYTVGNSIVFGTGRYTPHQEEGRNLLAHELVHTFQQGRVGAPVSGQRLTIESPESATEDEARAGADASQAAALRPRGWLRPSAVPVKVPLPSTVASPMVVARQLESSSQQAKHASQQAQQASQQAQHASQQAKQASQQAQQASQQAGDAWALANAALDEAQLASLRSVAIGHVNLAFAAYISACKEVRDSIKAAAKQNADMMAMVLDVAMGFATPGLSRWIVGFANRIPAASSTLEYRVAMAALNEDRVKAVLTVATKTASQTLKSHSTELAGVTEVDRFVGKLEVCAQEACQIIIDSVPGMTEAVEVGVVAAAFDVSIANHEVYRQDIKRLTDMYEREVSPIGGAPPMGGGNAEPMGRTMPQEAVWVQDGASKRLAIVNYQYMGRFGWGDFYMLASWVDPEMKDLVIQKQTDKGGKLKTIDKSELR
jgi:Domain of unknown function (DUF4157)